MSGGLWGINRATQQSSPSETSMRTWWSWVSWDWPQQRNQSGEAGKSLWHVLSVNVAQWKKQMGFLKLRGSLMCRDVISAWQGRKSPLCISHSQIKNFWPLYTRDIFRGTNNVVLDVDRMLCNIYCFALVFFACFLGEHWLQFRVA